MRDSDYLSKALPCPYCACNELSLWQGSVTCDECMAQGPFAGHFDGKDYGEEQRRKEQAVTRWNARPRAA
jgi:hypothetical protein